MKYTYVQCDLNGKILKEFHTFSEFVTWKEEEENKTMSKYVRQRGSKKLKNGDIVINYHCCRSGMYKPKGKGIKRLKSQGSAKIGISCPAVIKVRHSTENVVVQYFPKHQNHETQLEHLRISESDRTAIAGMDEIEEKNSHAADDVSKIIIGDVRSDVVKVIDTDGTFSSSPNLEDIREIQSNFAKQRNWEQYHQPRNLLFALVGEVGELAELFQWRGEVKEGLPDWTEEDKEHLSQELSDVLLYLIRLSEKCHIDLPAAVLKKISMNAEKYPVLEVWGSDKKYIKYEDSS
ncbi:dCTP pyrophosphatase 1 [Trichonephila inaurata madagascariensis]|uniref:dCTP pyrophosphatase 1 n=1 Tax=Trichonephila inaurata madagascariensis TaxID=2747483 RepID=A0A8X7C401_9ARAC|nr:dCTP pyrophosphatase 1 [Trichonephila inaurata madagascariensis]